MHLKNLTNNMKTPTHIHESIPGKHSNLCSMSLLFLSSIFLWNIFISLNLEHLKHCIIKIKVKGNFTTQRCNTFIAVNNKCWKNCNSFLKLHKATKMTKVRHMEKNKFGNDQWPTFVELHTVESSGCVASVFFPQ